MKGGKGKGDAKATCSRGSMFPSLMLITSSLIFSQLSSKARNTGNCSESKKGPGPTRELLRKPSRRNFS